MFNNSLNIENNKMPMQEVFLWQCLTLTLKNTREVGE